MSASAFDAGFSAPAPASLGPASGSPRCVWGWDEFARDVDDVTIDAFQASLGARLVGDAFEFGGYEMTPEFRVGYVSDLGDANIVDGENFIAASDVGFDIVTPGPGDDAAILGLRLVGKGSDRSEFFVDYQTDNRTDAFGQAVRAGLEYQFWAGVGSTTELTMVFAPNIGVEETGNLGLRLLRTMGARFRQCGGCWSRSGPAFSPSKRSTTPPSAVRKITGRTRSMARRILRTAMQSKQGQHPVKDHVIARVVEARLVDDAGGVFDAQPNSQGSGCPAKHERPLWKAAAQHPHAPRRAGLGSSRRSGGRE